MTCFWADRDKSRFPSGMTNKNKAPLQAGAFGVGFYGARDFQSEREGGGGVLRGDDGGLAGADGVEEGFDLEAEGFAFGDFYVAEAQAGGWMVSRLCRA